MKNKIIQCTFLILLLFVSCNSENNNGIKINTKENYLRSNVQKIKATITEEDVLQTDLSKIINPDSISTEDQTIKRSILGFIGNNYQRFEIHFTKFEKSKLDNKLYLLTGKTRVKNTICSFIGELRIKKVEINKDSIRLLDEDEFSKNHSQITIISEIEIYENRTEKHSGCIKGILTTDLFADSTNKIHYNSLMFFADGFSNNSFEGRWTSYFSKETKICNWGDFRIPNSGDLDIGVSEFSINDKYEKNGWESYSKQYSVDQTNKETINAQFRENSKWWELKTPSLAQRSVNHGILVQ